MLLAIVLLWSSSTYAAKTVNLLGFVDNLCPQQPYCFELVVEPEFVAIVGERIRVRFDSAINIFDPENYELTLEKQNLNLIFH